MRRVGSLVGLSLLLSLAGFPQAADAASLTFSGSAVGCFNCTSSSLTAAPTTVGGLTFDGDSLTVNADNTVDLGTFTLALSSYNYSSQHTSFLLGVTFTAPAALDGAYTAEIEGSINRQGNGAVNVQLDPTYHSFTFSNADGSGSFDFGMFASKLQLQPDDTSVVLLGLIRNLQFTPTITDVVQTGTQGPDSVPTPVPEPASLTLLASGFGAAILRLRGRRASLTLSRQARS